MEVNERIKTRRKMLKLTLKDVAQALNVSESLISRYESNDVKNMGIDKLVPLAKVLSTTPAYLMGWTDNPDAHDYQYQAKEGGKLMTVAESPPNYTYQSKELEALIAIFNKINTQGQQKILVYANDLLQSGLYKKSSHIPAAEIA